MSIIWCTPKNWTTCIIVSVDGISSFSAEEPCENLTECCCAYFAPSAFARRAPICAQKLCECKGELKCVDESTREEISLECGYQFGSAQAEEEDEADLEAELEAEAEAELEA